MVRQKFQRSRQRIDLLVPLDDFDFNPLQLKFLRQKDLIVLSLLFCTDVRQILNFIRGRVERGKVSLRQIPVFSIYLFFYILKR